MFQLLLYNYYLCRMLTAFKTYIQENSLCTTGEKILVAVSGGVDSVVLLDLFVKAGYHIAIAHCNFKLRGNESDSDELFVKKLAEQYNTGLFVKTCPAGDFANEQSISIQEAARELRYDFFEKLIKTKRFDKVAVAHHADDNLETFFINLMRGSGLQGLKGMPVQRDQIIRPLMFTTRQQIEDYANKHGISWRNDSSNDSDKYLRNNIRHHLLPELRKINPDFKTLFQSLSHLKQDALVLETLINNEKRKRFKEKDGQIIIPFENLEQKLPPALWLYYLLKDFGFPQSETGKIADAVQSNSTGKHFFSETDELLIDRNEIIIRKRKTVHQEVFHIDGSTTSLTQPFKATISVLSGNEIKPAQLKESNAAYLDFEKLTFPLTLRKWKKGDRFHPYGMKGSKLLSDFFTDLKLSLFEKENSWLLLSGDNIIWVVGKRIAEQVKINSGTKKIWCIRLTNNSTTVAG